MKYFVYILKSKRDGKLYTGYSTDPNRRLLEHNSGETKSLYKRRPLEIIYKEEFEEELTAKRRERFLKSGQGRIILKSILNR